MNRVTRRKMDKITPKWMEKRLRQASKDGATVTPEQLAKELRRHANMRGIIL